MRRVSHLACPQPDQIRGASSQRMPCCPAASQEALLCWALLFPSHGVWLPCAFITQRMHSGLSRLQNARL